MVDDNDNNDNDGSGELIKCRAHEIITTVKERKCTELKIVSSLGILYSENRTLGVKHTSNVGNVLKL